MTPGAPVAPGLRVELSDADITTAPNGSLLLRAVDTIRPNSEIEIELPSPTVSDDLVITMETFTRWAFRRVTAAPIRSLLQ